MQAVEVEAREGYRVWLRYSDGAAGEVDLTHLAGRGVFQAWGDREQFEAVHIAAHGAVAWGEDIELCADDLYLRLTGKAVGRLSPRAQGLVVEWASLRQAELQEAWDRAKRLEHPGRIAPLD